MTAVRALVAVDGLILDGRVWAQQLLLLRLLCLLKPLCDGRMAEADVHRIVGHHRALNQYKQSKLLWRVYQKSFNVSYVYQIYKKTGTLRVIPIVITLAE